LFYFRGGQDAGRRNFVDLFVHSIDDLPDEPYVRNDEELDTRLSNNDTATMRRSILAVVIALIWLAVSGLANLSQPAGPGYRDTDKSARFAELGPGDINEGSDDLKGIASKLLSRDSIFHALDYTTAEWLTRQALLPKADYRLYKIHVTFLI
jgi:hypothetical protein